jgi:hypothetical protein
MPFCLSGAGEMPDFQSEKKCVLENAGKVVQCLKEPAGMPIALLTAILLNFSVYRLTQGSW